MSDFGAGPVLDEDNDWVVDNTGDIKSTVQEPSNTAELQKDLAFQSQRELGDQIGRAVKPATAAVIRNRIERLAENHSRIDRVLELTVREIQNGYEASLTVQTVDEDANVDLIFELN